LADTFNNWFEPGNLAAARKVLEAAGYEVVPARGADSRPLCCGRTYLSAGMVERAKAESRRMLDALAPWIERGVPVVGLEPSCLYSLRDEFLAMHPGDSRAAALAGLAFTFDSFVAKAVREGAKIAWREGAAPEYLVHGHCHQKAFGAFEDTLAALRAVPGAKVTAVESSCCGMAGSFGHEHYDVSMAMGEASLLPAVRAAGPGTTVVAAGTSCRHQIDHGASRAAVHPAVALAAALAP
jgi:Fe-S oxidoreductase